MCLKIEFTFFISKENLYRFMYLLSFIAGLKFEFGLQVTTFKFK
jgi:hypothetical protein